MPSFVKILIELKSNNIKKKVFIFLKKLLGNKIMKTFLHLLFIYFFMNDKIKILKKVKNSQTKDEGEKRK